MTSEFTRRIYELTARIPAGKVVSYGQLARWAGRPRASRIVGYAMHNASVPGLPYHRVVFKDGTLCAGEAFGNPRVQRQMLEEEGVDFDAAGRVDMERFCWQGPWEKETNF